MESWLKGRNGILPNLLSVSGEAGFRVFRGGNRRPGGGLTTEDTGTPFGRHGKRPEKKAFHTFRPHFRRMFLDMEDFASEQSTPRSGTLWDARSNATRRGGAGTMRAEPSCRAVRSRRNASLPVRPSHRSASHQRVVSVAINCDPPATPRVQHVPCEPSRGQSWISGWICVLAGDAYYWRDDAGRRSTIRSSRWGRALSKPDVVSVKRTS